MVPEFEAVEALYVAEMTGGVVFMVMALEAAVPVLFAASLSVETASTSTLVL